MRGAIKSPHWRKPWRLACAARARPAGRFADRDILDARRRTVSPDVRINSVSATSRAEIYQ